MSMLVNSYVFASGAVASYPLTNFAAGPTIANTNAQTTALTLTANAADLTASATYMGIYSCEALTDHTTGAGNTVRVTDGVTTYVSALMGAKNVSTPQDKRAIAGLFQFQPGASPATTNFNLTTQDTASGTATVQNSRVTLIKLGADDFSAVSTGGTISSATYSTFCTLNFTPASAGDYLLIASATMRSNGGGRITRAKLVCGASTIEYIARAADLTDSPFLWIMPLTGLSGAQTATIQVRSDGAGTITVDDLCIFAIRRDRFAAVYSAVLGADAAGTETTYTEALATTNTPIAANHLALWAWGQEGSLTTESIYTQVTDGGSVLVENITEPRGAVADDSATMCGAHTVAAYTATSRKHAIDRKSESGATSRVRQNATIAVFNLTGI